MKARMTKGLLMTALITGSVVWGGTSVFAEEALQEYTLDQMVVTATRTEKKIIDVPASVEVVTAKDIEKSGAVYVDDALKKVAGIAVSRTGGIGNSKPVVSMRGVKSGSDVLVLVDGQPMDNAYSGVVNWNDIPVESIEKIEIVKGPSSAIYGSNAMAGVINITTKDSEKLHAKTSLTYGTNHTWIKKVNLGDKVGKFSYDLYYQGTDSHTYSDWAKAGETTRKEDPKSTNRAKANNYPLTPTSSGGKQAVVGKKGNKIWDEDTYKGKFTYKFDDSKSLSLGYIKTKNEYSYDYSSAERWLGKGYYDIKNGNTIGGKYFNVSDTTFTGAPGGVDEKIYTIGYTDKENGLRINAGLTDNTSWNGGYYCGLSTKYSYTTYNSKRYTLGVTKEAQLSDNDAAVFGIQYQHDTIDKVKFNTKNVLDQSALGKADTYGVFFQNEHKFNDKLSAIAALRYDTWHVKDGYVYDQNSGIKESPASRSDSSVSPKLALNYKFDDTQSAYLAWGQAFSAPGLYDMFSGTINGKTKGTPASEKSIVIPNPNLKPQIITTTEAGYKKSFNDKTILQMAVFHNKIKNINYQGATGNPDHHIKDDDQYDGQEAGTSPYIEKQLTSEGEGKTIGFEIGVTHQFDDKLSAYVNATIQNPVITKGASEKENDKIVRMTPKRLFNIGIDYVDNKFSAELAGNYYSKKFGQADNSDTITGVPGAYDPVFLMNFTSKYSFDKHHGLEFSVFNLFDREYNNSSLGQGRNFLLTYSYTF